jgi:hypothetical protein
VRFTAFRWPEPRRQPLARSPGADVDIPMTSGDPWPFRTHFFRARAPMIWKPLNELGTKPGDALDAVALHGACSSGGPRRPVPLRATSAEVHVAGHEATARGQTLQGTGGRTSATYHSGFVTLWRLPAWAAPRRNNSTTIVFGARLPRNAMVTALTRLRSGPLHPHPPDRGLRLFHRVRRASTVRGPQYFRDISSAIFHP